MGCAYSKDVAIFLKNVPDNPPLNAVEVFMSGTEYLNLKAGNMSTSIAAESPCDWGNFDFQIDKNLFLRLLSAGHTKIEACDGHAPIVATGGIGRYIAMPLYRKIEPKIEPETQPDQEESKMETNENKVVSAQIKELLESLEDEFQRITNRVELEEEDKEFRLDGVKGKLCLATVKARIRERKKQDGYEIEVDTDSKPDMIFWGLCGVGAILVLIGLFMTAYSWTPIVLTLLAGVGCIGGAIFFLQDSSKKIGTTICDIFRKVVKDCK